VDQIRIAAVEAYWRAPLARLGLVAKGMLFGALGVLAIQVARGERASGAVSQRGAIELVADQPLGQWLLGILTVGLFALAVWQALLAVKGDPVEGSEPLDRLTYAVKAVIYFGTGMIALMVLVPDWGISAGSTAGGADSQDQAAATVMSFPGGRWLVGLAGLAIIGAATYQGYAHAWHRRFMRRLNRQRIGAHAERWLARAGAWGYAARAGVLLIVGIFLVVAAYDHDPQEAVGVAGALDEVAAQPWGGAGLWLVALGLFLYGCYCFTEARYRREL
jgi:hypothetical protein